MYSLSVLITLVIRQVYPDSLNCSIAFSIIAKSLMSSQKVAASDCVYNLHHGLYPFDSILLVVVTSVSSSSLIDWPDNNEYYSPISH